MAAPDLSDSSGAVPGELRAIAGRVEARVALLLDHEATRWAAIDPDSSTRSRPSAGW